MDPYGEDPLTAEAVKATPHTRPKLGDAETAERFLSDIIAG